MMTARARASGPRLLEAGALAYYARFKTWGFRGFGGKAATPTAG